MRHLSLQLPTASVRAARRRSSSLLQRGSSSAPPPPPTSGGAAPEKPPKRSAALPTLQSEKQVRKANLSRNSRFFEGSFSSGDSNIHHRRPHRCERRVRDSQCAHQNTNVRPYSCHPQFKHPIRVTSHQCHQERSYPIHVTHSTPHSCHPDCLHPSRVTPSVHALTSDDIFHQRKQDGVNKPR